MADTVALTMEELDRLHVLMQIAERRRGRPSNRRLTDATRDHALTLLRERYADFGPIFAHQKLTEEHGLAFSVETLRGWMNAARLWVPRAQRARRSQPPRPRRACPGELVQIDGSDHAWFEERGPRCTLLVYVDDATSRLMELCFAPTESTFDYFRAGRLASSCGGTTSDKACGLNPSSQFGCECICRCPKPQGLARALV